MRRCTRRLPARFASSARSSRLPASWYDDDVRWLAAVALLCAGCDQLFGIDHVPAASDATDCAAIGPDEDGDCVPDSVDNCPATPNADQADVRETVPDGVGDACDPHPTQEGDTI